MPADPLATPAIHPVAFYLVEPHSELDGCFQIARHGPGREAQRVGNYTSKAIAVDVAKFLNARIEWEAP